MCSKLINKSILSFESHGRSKHLTFSFYLIKSVHTYINLQLYYNEKSTLSSNSLIHFNFTCHFHLKEVILFKDVDIFLQHMSNEKSKQTFNF